MAWAEAAWGWAKASKAPLASSTGAAHMGRSWGKPGAMASFQVDFQRLSLDLPACTIRAMELTIIERASQLLARF